MSTSFITGDTAPALSGSVGTNVTGGSIELHLRRPDRTVLTRAATITDASTGAWSMAWQVDDLEQAGSWNVEAQITFSSGLIQTVGPARFFVREAIA